IVNIISWLQTKKDGLLVQPSFYPFKLVSNLARGNALDLYTSAPMIETPKYGGVAALDVSASHDPASGNGAVFIVNRSQSDAITTEIDWQGDVPGSVKEVWQLAGSDLKMVNSWETPNNLVAKPVNGVTIRDGKMTLQVPPLSFTAVSVG
ncbi:MAG: alpha-N-arabinofuranosidase, partial [Caldilineaceae bacterium]|nr:alpha-N-arabinofuranosidase [Caldilineaceae bacterium]